LLLIKNGTIVTMDDKRTVIKDGAIAIDGNKIIDIGRTEKISKQQTWERIIDAKAGIIIPGLINAHTHICNIMMRGLGTDKVLLEWLEKSNWPGLEAMNEEDSYLGGLVGAMESVKNGTTCMVDNFYTTPDKQRRCFDKVAQAIEEMGLRAILVGGYHDKEFNIPNRFVYSSPEKVVSDYTYLLEKWHNKADDRIKVWISPVNLLFCTEESIQKTHRLAEKWDVGIHTHVAESNQEVKLVKERFGRPYVEVFNDLGVLGPKFHAAHSVWLSDREIELMSETGSKVIHNPTSNMFLASGVAPIPKMLKAGVTVGLGCDGGNCTNALDMFENIKLTTLLQKVHSLNPLALSADQAFRMATIEGAKVLCMEDQIGSLEEGKKADIAIVDTRAPNMTPIHDPLASLVYSARGSNVNSVIIDGKVIMENRILQNTKNEEILEKAQTAALSLAIRMGNKN
jgi:5-methylthioadenosine/S-adenosylhomocysteine deaminase